ncbi:MAG: hypothetical protein COU35_04490 [Candidatus Magasanikbacteria bacterium CG10_big_fil_rev_8_21_14_0_10_47_10]|uniref:Rhodanese domain-containing protein n=1 Tax=Candidatus Magasanikbacteria bacterium CG10_big_fil_rev_8_21_14_0_10_47_10 TaxID=1974652 RepID=A0A2H0TPJ9_9BACT|nr:MAG: hypothetical protein COU35_04490 [Candidatus Magasanikbacteria bacterium CG10_big_fil_rev_8_21_14_0_10_47_10]
MQPHELKQHMESGEDIDLIDVREATEFTAGSKIPGSRNIPMGQIFLDAGAGKFPKDKKIVVLCKSGARCDIVARELTAKGYNIESLEGGVEAWERL